VIPISRYIAEGMALRISWQFRRSYFFGQLPATIFKSPLSNWLEIAIWADEHAFQVKSLGRLAIILHNVTESEENHRWGRSTASTQYHTWARWKLQFRGINHASPRQLPQRIHESTNRRIRIAAFIVQRDEDAIGSNYPIEIGTANAGVILQVDSGTEG